MIYFDNSATTAIDPAVLDTYVKVSTRIMGNPSSLHQLGTQAQRLVRQARGQIAELLGCEANEIFFTSGGTEGNNWIVKGTAYEKRPFGKHLILSAIEHPSVSETAAQLAAQGFDISLAPVDEHGQVMVKELAQLIRKDTILVSVMAVNNEVGTQQPIAEISALLAEYPTIHFHVDAVQAIGKVPVTEWLTERVDFVTFSAHKFHGPRGMGFIYRKKGRRLEALLAGGGQEQGQRSTTENVAGIVATAKALRLTLTDSEWKAERVGKLRDTLADALKSFPTIEVFTDPELAAPHILCFGIKGIRGEVVVHAFEEKEIFVSTTSACSSKKKAASSTLHAMGVPDKAATTAVRVSLDEKNTVAELEQFMIILKQLVQKFAKLS